LGLESYTLAPETTHIPDPEGFQINALNPLTPNPSFPTPKRPTKYPEEPKPHTLDVLLRRREYGSFHQVSKRALLELVVALDEAGSKNGGLFGVFARVASGEPGGGGDVIPYNFGILWRDLVVAVEAAKGEGAYWEMLNEVVSTAPFLVGEGEVGGGGGGGGGTGSSTWAVPELFNDAWRAGCEIGQEGKATCYCDEVNPHHFGVC
jgi:hypothetical protein